MSVFADSQPIFAPTRRALSLLVLGVLAACMGSEQDNANGSSATRANTSQVNGSGDPLVALTETVQKATCGAGDLPETGLQGRVSLEDRESGRSAQGYRCNMRLVGQYQGEGATWVNPIYKNCAYMGTSFNGIPLKSKQGVQVVDATNPARPVFAGNLTSPAFAIGPWESLKVNARRGLLAGTAVGPILGALFLDVYDISKDCAKPELLNKAAGPITLPLPVLGHEGGWSPDGLTYWVTSSQGHIAAIGMEDPKQPKMLYLGSPTGSNHGFEFSPDGTRMYAASIQPTGLVVLDVSDIQKRLPNPQIRQISSLLWSANGNTQSTIPFIKDGRHYLVVVDELDTGVVRLLDIENEKKPFVISHLKLEIHQKDKADLRASDNQVKAQGQLGNNGLFGYEAHYCSLDSPVNPTALACGYFQSGIRVFDIRNLQAPREIAYYNPPAQAANKLRLQGSEHNSLVAGQNAGLTTDWCSSPPMFKSNNQLWVVCQDNGFMVLEFTHGAYPIAGTSQ